jgi:hypothetical protein
LPDISIRRISLERIWKEEQRRTSNDARNREKAKNIRRDHGRSEDAKSQKASG